MFASILSRAWWMILLRGIVAILFGVMVFAQPGITLASLVFVFACFAVFDGITHVGTALGGGREQEHFWLLLLTGLAGIAIGVLTFTSPQITALALLFYIALWAIATGLMQIVAAIRLRREIEGEFWLGLAGAASVLFGLLLVTRPAAGALAVLWLIGSYALAYGVIVLVLGFKARAFARRVRGAVTAT